MKVPDDVDYRRTQSGSHQDQCQQGRRHRLARGSGRDPVGTHQQPHRTFQIPREGQSFASGPFENGRNAPFAARLYQAEGRGALQDAARKAQHSPLSTVRARILRAFLRADIYNVRAAYPAAIRRLGVTGKAPVPSEGWTAFETQGPWQDRWMLIA